MVKAYVLIINESGTEDSVISNLKNIPSITDAFGTFGTWDILTKLVSSNEENIQHDISKGIRKISNIRSTLTLLVDKKLGISKTNEIEQKVLDSHMAQAFITIHCSKSDEYRVMKNLEEIPEVVEADVLIGNYEIICRLAAPTYNDISEIVSKKIRKIPGIKSTITINVINNQGFSHL
ncbi:MAG: Lrp/AsnC ligand binding domain-containing protein [Thaumarchaeota archaeon]|nr:Lrp/AsnC ligand binding domain-containing protein [Nitrososphaerota archaeon]